MEPRTSTLPTEPHSWLKSSTFLIVYFNLLFENFIHVYNIFYESIYLSLTFSSSSWDLQHSPPNFFVLFIFIALSLSSAAYKHIAIEPPTGP